MKHIKRLKFGQRYSKFQISLARHKDIKAQRHRVMENSERFFLRHSKEEFKIEGIIFTIIILFIFLFHGVNCLADWDKGLELYKQEQYANASIEFQKIIKNNPKWASGYYMLALCQLNTGKEKDAMLNFQKTLEFDSNHAGALFYMGKKYYERQKYNEAVEYLTKALTYSKNNAEKKTALTLRGTSNFKLGKYDSSAADFRELLLLGSKDAFTYYMLGLSSFNNKDYENASIAFERAASIEPANREYEMLYLQSLLNVRKYNDVIKRLENVKMQTEGDQETIKIAADAYLGAKEYKNAILYYTRLKNPDNVSLFNLAQAYSAQEKFSKAEIILLKLKEKESRNDKIYDLLGYIYEKTGKLNESLEALQKAYNLTRKVKYLEGIKRVKEKIKQQMLDKEIK
ncbi:MAG: hypothetical protein A2Y62_04040 [Candidatus Fischerbacteria bacterium RBG_13_37_8]|uniref:Uncharacterized protein n=1 Tax=Candidatus Fischerbacteria bacterium RBG_13_37_8 TaxID=1817863 RepID=A0A1F5V4R2_9BACT|nr:MAG: hypothetical protein A2Y62_04040 [Candidatus Fischerbacteria bacterium RBG_13_37_8]